MARVDRPPEAVGVVQVVLRPDVNDETRDVPIGAMLAVGPNEGEVVVGFGTPAGLITIHLDGKKAFHLSCALLRARARAARNLS